MRAVTINSEFSLPRLSITHEYNYYKAPAIIHPSHLASYGPSDKPGINQESLKVLPVSDHEYTVAELQLSLTSV